MGAYDASKAGLEGLGRTLQMELEGTGVRASIVRPGPTSTEMGWDWDPAAIEALLASWRRWGLTRHPHTLPVESIAKAVLAVGQRAPGHQPRRSSRSSPRHRSAQRPEARREPDDPDESPRSPATTPTGHLEELRHRPDRADARGCATSAATSASSAWPTQVVLLSGAEANEVFFRASDEELDQAEAYPFMTPDLRRGRGVRRLPRAAPRDAAQPGPARQVHAGPRRDHRRARSSGWSPSWGDEGEIDLLDWFAELTIYTSSACLIGKRFREELDRRFAELYHDLERGTDAIAYVDPYADIESFRRRDAARAGLVELVQAIMDARGAGRGRATDRDLLDVLMSITDDDGTPRFSADEVTGMFISMMFAGHHTTSGTAVVEL